MDYKEREGVVGREIMLSKAVDMQNYALLKYDGFPEEITFQGETMSFREALLNPDAFEQIRDQYEAQGETEAVEALNDFRFWQNRIDIVLLEYEQEGVPKLDEAQSQSAIDAQSMPASAV